MKLEHTVILVVALLALLATPLASAEVVVFQKYDTSMEYKDGSLLITKQLRLKNVGSTPIIPGEIHFKLSQETKDGAVAPEVSSFDVVDKFGDALDTRKYVSEDEVDLVFTVWDPLLPDFFYELTMTYEIDFKPKGVLFYQVALPEEKTTIPIKQAKTTFTLPSHYHVTYASGDSEMSDEGVSWDKKGNYVVEYSVIPFPRLGFKAVNLFWALIIILFLVNLFYRLKKKARRT